jgi:hypothetical protein
MKRTLGRWIAAELAASAASPITNRIADGVDVGTRIAGLASEIKHGTDELMRASTRRRGAVLGGEFWHGASDRASALAQIGLDMRALHDELERVALDPHVPPATLIWIASDARAAWLEWLALVQRIAQSKLVAYATEWTVYETWWARLQRLREMARLRGIELTSSEPMPLPETVWQRGARGKGAGLDVWMTLGKTAVFGMMTLSGIVGFYAILRSMRSKPNDQANP